MALDVAGGESAQAGVQAAARGEGPDQDDLVAVGAVVELGADRIVVGPHVERILVGQRDVDDGAGAAALAGGGHPRFRAAQRVAHGVRGGVGEQGVAVLVFAVGADQAGLAVAGDGLALRGLAHAPAELGAQPGRGVDPQRKVFHVFAGVRIVDARGQDDFAQRLAVCGRAGLAGQGVLDLQIPFADVVDAEVGRFHCCSDESGRGRGRPVRSIGDGHAPGRRGASTRPR